MAGWVKLGLVLLTCGSAALPAVAADIGRGRVALQGAIVDVPCGIEAGDLYQALDMGGLPISQLVRDGAGAPLPFSIGLSDCQIGGRAASASVRAIAQRIQVYLDGINDAGRFGVTGTARGVALMIRDAQGHEIAPGGLSSSVPLQGADLALRFTLTPVGNGEALQAGEYHSTVSFRVEYF